MNQQTPLDEHLKIDSHVSNIGDWLSVGIEIISKLEEELDAERHHTEKTQLEQISSVVETLTKQRVNVPDELRKLKLDLSHRTNEYEEAMAEIEGFRSGLSDLYEFLDEAFPVAGKSRKRSSASKASQPRKNSFYKKYMTVVPAILLNQGGEMPVSKIMEAIEKRFCHTFTEEELELNSNSQPKWRGHVSFARYMLVKEGVLSKNPPSGCWKLKD